MNKPAVRPVVWIVAAVAVTATATALITASLVADDSVLSPQDVDRALAAATDTQTATPTTSVTDVVTPSNATGDLTVLEPGTVTVRCDGALATLVSWSPNPGWRADDPMRGPAAQVSVRFESDTDADYKVTATCVNGAPVVNLGPDDHSGRDDDHDDDNRGRGGGDDY